MRTVSRCGMNLQPRRLHDALSIYRRHNALKISHRSCNLLHPRNRPLNSCRKPPLSCLFHNDSEAAQGTAAAQEAPVEDGGVETEISEVNLPLRRLRADASVQEKDIGAERESPVFAIDLPKANLESAIQTLELARAYNLPLDDIVLGPSPQAPLTTIFRTYPQNDEALASRMKEDLMKARGRMSETHTLGARYELPLMAEKTQDSLLKTVRDYDVTIILAKTGSGKTTQVPQILLDDKIMSREGPTVNIICTQPRRIAATSIAQRVAAEREDTIANRVGYHIRHENLSPTAPGSITYCTTGILLKRLIIDAQGPLLAHSHILVDEVHERDIQIDLAVSLLRNSLRARKAQGLTYPKIILMSATIDASKFIDYLTRPAPDGTVLTAGCLDVEGESAQVETHYLPEILSDLSGGGQLPRPMSHFIYGNHKYTSKRYLELEQRFADEQAKLISGWSKKIADDKALPSASAHADGAPETGSSTGTGLAASVIVHICINQPEGDILAFFPGSADMDNVETILRHPSFAEMGFNLADSSNYKLFKLHSMRQETNAEVFSPVPAGCRRIILATSIAETSITLPRVVYVVDSGRSRAALFDHSTLARSLPFQWISKTSSIQRRGRAGRSRNGHYYGLFTKTRFDSLPSMNRPQIRVSDLAEVALLLKAFPQHAAVQDILLDTIDPPAPQAVTAAFKQLRNLGALTSGNDITSLGRFLCQLPIHPSLGKAVLQGSFFGCLEPMLIIASHDTRSPLMVGFNANAEALRAVKRQYRPEDETDFAWLVELFREYHAAYIAGDHDLVVQLQRTKHVRHSAYLDMLQTCKGIHDVLARAKFTPPPSPEKTVFEVIPDGLNANKDNMSLVKALLINTVSSELAIWPNFPGTPLTQRWKIDSSNSGLMSNHGALMPKGRIPRQVANMYRSHGRLMAYTRRHETSDGLTDAFFLAQASMVTPLMAILFSQDVAQDDHQTLKLNQWLRLQLNPPTGVPRASGDKAATIMMDLRKTMDRVMGLAWSELEKLNTGATGKFDKAHARGRRLGPALRTVMVQAVLDMLKADEAHWKEFRTNRRDEIARDVEKWNVEADEAQEPEEEQADEAEVDVEFRASRDKE